MVRNDFYLRETMGSNQCFIKWTIQTASFKVAIYVETFVYVKKWFDRNLMAYSHFVLFFFMYHFNECFYRKGINLRSLAEKRKLVRCPFLFNLYLLFFRWIFLYFSKQFLLHAVTWYLSVFYFGCCLMTTCGEVNTFDHFNRRTKCVPISTN